MQHKPTVTLIHPRDFYERFVKNPESLLDIRECDERQALYIPGSSHLPLSVLFQQIESLYPDKEQPVYLLCHRGRRSESAALELSASGYQQVFSIEGGIVAWENAGFPVIKTN